jgi:hypothetical protein
MQRRDLQRHIEINDLGRFALNHPALVSNLIHSTPRACFSHVNGAHNYRPGKGKEAIVCVPQFIKFETVCKPFRKVTAHFLHGHFIRIESLFPKEKAKTSEKPQTLFMSRKLFEGNQVRAIAND